MSDGETIVARHRRSDEPRTQHRPATVLQPESFSEQFVKAFEEFGRATGTIDDNAVPAIGHGDTSDHINPGALGSPGPASRRQRRRADREAAETCVECRVV